MAAGSTSEERAFVPAAGHDWLLPLYDLFAKLVGSEAAHRRLVEQADIRPGQRVLDIGCGTGNLTLLAKRLHPQAEVVGLDPDAKALFRARRKAERRALEVRLDRGFADALAYPDASFDHVLSAFMLHHLAPDDKERTLREVRRVLREGGAFHAVDFGGTGHGGLLAHLFHHAHLADQHRIPALMREAGLEAVRELPPMSTILGRVSSWRGSRPLERGATRASS
jgi:ubiquinone/menaquinone biosynthesis C-methylase UbiE